MSYSLPKQLKAKWFSLPLSQLTPGVATGGEKEYAKSPNSLGVLLTAECTKLGRLLHQ